MNADERFRSFFRTYMNVLGAIAPRRLAGGRWDEIGQLQLDFLVAQGLQPEHTVLDVGCGCLRAGLHIIRYCDAGKYCGLDISERMIAAGHRFLAAEGLDSKAPTVFTSRDLKFAELEPRRFDFVFAHSVFTHAPPAIIEECLGHVHRVMTDRGVFFATYLDGGASSYKRGPLRTIFYHPLSLFLDFGREYGYRIELVDSFEHRRKEHRMMKISRQ